MEFPISKEIVSAEWLHDHINDPDLIVLNATIPKVDQVGDTLADNQIPNGVFFDLKNTFSDTSAPFPNTVPNEEQFQREARNIGINKNSFIVIYDELGMYSSPRAWYLFKAFGHDNVAVLDGGLPAWLQKGYATEKIKDKKGLKGNIEASYRPQYFIDLEALQKLDTNEGKVILDARSSARFRCEVPEPRKGLRSGTIPGSKNLPFTELMENGLLKPEKELNDIFENVSNKDGHLIMSCGSGITACILALGAFVSGRENISVYDGSWTEYGSLIKP